MRISDIIRDKGGTVVTVTPETSVHDLLALLAEHRIGAAVVSSDGRSVEGIVSERDIVRALADRDAAIMAERVADIMTTDVSSCHPDTHIDELMRIMTHGRFRHVPVVVDGALRGLVSIGDVVKFRIDELEVERDSLTKYISSAG